MFKQRIRQWGFDKKLKESDMLVIRRKNSERHAKGKKTAVRVHGRIVAPERFEQYFRRKAKYRRTGLARAPTPPYISCFTPLPAQTPTPVEDEPPTFAIQVSASNGSAWAPNSTERDVGQSRIARARTPGLGFILDEDGVPFVIDRHRKSLTYRSSVPSSPTSPSNFLIPEYLLFNVRAYIESSFETGTWTTDEEGYCVNITPGFNIRSSAHEDFQVYCIMAADILADGDPVQFRRLLSLASVLVPEILQAEHPEALEYLLDSFIYLSGEGFHAAVRYLCTFIAEAASLYLRGNTPWRNICQSLGRLDVGSMSDSMFQVWKCTFNNFVKRLGLLNKSTLRNHLAILNREYRLTNHVQEGVLLRKLLFDCEQFLGETAWQNKMIITELGYNLIHQERYEEAEQLGLDILSQHEDKLSFWGKVGFLELVARSQYYEGKEPLAEKNMRDAIVMIAGQYGVEYPDAIDMKIWLERWLRNWGRHEDGDILRAEIEEAIEEDDVDREQKATSA